MNRLISVDMEGSFGFLKKPDINDGMYLTYNMLHKPAVLGIFGAITGLKGYHIVDARKKHEPYIPEYREKFDDLKIAIQPLGATDGNFMKNVIRYTNTVGYANADGTLIIDEQTLVSPSYRVFVVLNDEIGPQRLLLERLKNGEAEYVPYFGKNEHQLWWKGFKEWNMENFEATADFKVDSLFVLPSKKLERTTRRKSLTGAPTGSFMYFERLPKGWQTELPQYELAEFTYTDFPLSKGNELDNLKKAKNEDDEFILYLF